MIFGEEKYKNQCVLQSVSKHFMELDVHNSTALEGNELSRAEVAAFLETGMTSHGKRFKDYVEVYNYNNALNWLKRNIHDCDLELSILLIKKFHSMVTNNLLNRENDPEKNYSGKLRDDYVFLTTTTYIPPKAEEVEELLEKEISKYYKRLESGYNVLEAACIFHREFERIHPFYDGNGRTGRILLNLLIIQDGYPYLTIDPADRMGYFDSLENDTFFEFAKELFSKSYDKYLFGNKKV